MFKSKIIAFTVCFFCTNAICKAQHHISKYEMRWAVFHPFAALNIKKQLPVAMEVYKRVKTDHLLDNEESGGTLDAFRHSFTMAFLSQRIKVRKLRKLGIAHEKGNKLQFLRHELEDNERPDSLACEMDLRNNELGFLIGSNNKKLNLNDLKEKILLEIKAGNAWILKKNSQNQYVFCNNEPIFMENYRNSWFVPKCLIASN